jgi:hypothetical protein
MNDFLLALAVAAGGGFLMGQLDTASATSQQKASCVAQGGVWGTPDAGLCNKGGQDITTVYSLWGPVIDLGVPIAAAVLLTGSVGGIFGAVVGGAALMLISVSSIH